MTRINDQFTSAGKFRSRERGEVKTNTTYSVRQESWYPKPDWWPLIPSYEEDVAEIREKGIGGSVPWA